MTMIYTLVNKSNGVRVRSTNTYLRQWLARGFEVVEMEDTSKSKTSVKHPEHKLIED